MLRRCTGLLLWLISMLPGFVGAQNLVPNGSFETYRTCPQQDNLLAEAVPWYNPNRATPDFYHRCFDFGQMLLPPHSGQGLGHLFFDRGWAEYMGIRLTQPLKADECYYFELFVATDTPGKYITETLGAYVSKEPVLNPGSTERIRASPQVLDNTPKASVGRLQWQRISGTITARGGEEYLTIGSFYKDPPFLGSYYLFVDDISLTRVALDLGNDTTLCSRNDRYALDATTPGAIDYRWSDGSNKPTLQITQPGKYAVTVVTACKALTDSIRVNYALDFSLGRDTTLCLGQSLQLAAPDIAGATYRWQDGSRQRTFPVGQPGSYSVSVTQGGCAVLDAIQVRYVPPPTLDLGPDQTLCGTQVYIISPNVINGRFQWQDGFLSPNREVSHTGVFRATVQNECATLTDSISVDYSGCDCRLYAPNSFSPNDDGLNDTFITTGCGDITIQSLLIVNRWGDVIFEAKEEPFRWDGSFRGQPCSAGEYAWTVRYQLTRNRQTTAEKQHGPLLLIR